MILASCSSADDESSSVIDSPNEATTQATAVASPTAEPEPTAAPTAEPEPTATPTAEPEPTATPTAEPEPTTAPSVSDEVAEETDADSQAGETSEAGSITPSVKLLNPGAEPRIPLRLRLTSGCTELLVTNQTLEIEQMLGGTELPSAGAIGTISTAEISSEEVGDGRYLLTSEVIDATSAPGNAPEVAANLAASLEQTVGIRTSGEVDDRGRQVPATVTVEGTEELGLVGEMAGAAGQLSNPFPEDTIGVGGQWETTQTIELQGVDLTTQSTYTVIDIAGSIVTADVTLQQTVPDGSVMELPGVSTPVVSWETTGEGTTVFDLRSVAAVQSEITVTSFQELEIAPGQVLEQLTTTATQTTGELASGCAVRDDR